MANERTQGRASGAVLLLWGDYCDAVAATVFATEMRKVGLRVELVGLIAPLAADRHGVRLASDITLGDALVLAPRASCVVIPCSAAIMRRMDNDPRIYELAEQASTNHAHFVVQDMSVIVQSRLIDLAIAPTLLSTYAEADNLIAFARRIAMHLAGRSY